MKKINFLTLLLVGCSSLNPYPLAKREVASFEPSGPVKFAVELNQADVFASGADTVYLRFNLIDESSNHIKIDPSELRLLTDGEPMIGKIFYRDGGYEVAVTPTMGSPSLKAVLTYKDQISDVIDIKTRVKPRKDKLSGVRAEIESTRSINGIRYHNDHQAPEGQLDGIRIENLGGTNMVPNEDSKRHFHFYYPEHAVQNIAMNVEDLPNETTSHTMFSHFMFFPRTYLPVAHKNEEGQTLVTLPTGEKIVFSGDGEIVGGVFKEGKIDTGPDRFKRQFADLKYQGKGILLRANSRGQKPQQGEFEKNMIDMEFGIKFSTDVLIINGTTGQRCRRKKSEFWSSADVSPIQFKFATDKAFDSYLKDKCGFGIPELNLSLGSGPITYEEDLTQVWGKCESDPDLKTCLNSEVDLIQDRALRAKVRFEATLRFHSSKNEEKKSP